MAGGEGAAVWTRSSGTLKSPVSVGLALEDLSTCTQLFNLLLQLSIFFGALFIVSLAGAAWNSPVGFYLGSVGLSGFFTYEVCRKLDPTLPKVRTLHLCKHCHNG